jgi:hypothetical protein
MNRAIKGSAIACLMLFGAVAHAAPDETEGTPAVSAAKAAPADTPTMDRAEVNENSTVTQNERPVYVPPRRGAPATRVGGGTRSGESSMPKISPLSPEHTGLTAQSAPTLYWWLSEDHNGVFEFVVTAVDDVEPVLQIRSEENRTAGIHDFNLGAYNVDLEPGQLYQWSVAIVRDEQRRSHDIVGIATIERIASDGTAAVSPAALAAAGLWYDAIQLLSEPSDPAQADRYLAFRADLLEQVGLARVAAGSRTPPATN